MAELEKCRVPVEKINELRESQRRLEEDVTFKENFEKEFIFSAADKTEQTCKKIASTFMRKDPFILRIICAKGVEFETIDGITEIDQLKCFAKKGRVLSEELLSKKHNDVVASIIGELKDSKKRTLVKKVQ